MTKQKKTESTKTLPRMKQSLILMTFIFASLTLVAQNGITQLNTVSHKMANEDTLKRSNTIYLNLAPLAFEQVQFGYDFELETQNHIFIYAAVSQTSSKFTDLYVADRYFSTNFGMAYKIYSTKSKSSDQINQYLESKRVKSSSFYHGPWARYRLDNATFDFDNSYYPNHSYRADQFAIGWMGGYEKQFGQHFKLDLYLTLGIEYRNVSSNDRYYGLPSSSFPLPASAVGIQIGYIK